MNTRNIRPVDQHTVCDVCGRTLLRGEHAEAYVVGGERALVCELCTSRAIADGWIREGTVPDYDRGQETRERRRSLLRGLRSRLGGLTRPGEVEEIGDEYWSEPFTPEWAETDYGAPAAPARELGRETRLREPRVREPGLREPRLRESRVREPRHVHAVPTSPEHRVSSAIKAFNGSEHTRTVAGVARSLGPPAVTVIASDTHASVVHVVAAWELCWYRYEIDLADELPSVRVAAQGAELDELDPIEREANASADEDGALMLAR